MTIAETDAVDRRRTAGVRRLRARFRGALVLPREAGWERATEAFNLAFVQRPALVALPADEDDVIAVVNFAREHGMRLAPQRTGHNAEPLGAMDDLLLVRTDALQGVEIDPVRRIARVRSGSKWGDVVPQASELGLAALHGSTPDVSVAGYSLGGGVGWYARKHGLATNSVTAIEVVTADGRLRRVDHDHEPELFWALRGGGGNFGIVTALEFRLYPIPEVYAGVLFFPWERSSEVLHAWLDWTATVPEEVTSVGRILQFPPLPELPDDIRGRKFAMVDAVVIADERRGAELLQPLRALDPEIDTFGMVPPAGIAELHMDPPEPVPYTADGMMLGDLPGEAIDRFVAVAGPGSGSPLLLAEIRHVGGALHRAQPHHGALATFDASYLTLGVGMVFDDETHRANHERLERLADAFAPYDTGRQYLNFAERPTDPARFYTPDTYRRLQAVKAQYDPQQLFRANHPIPSGH
jgi:FAD/FMN-containing dehydrogenase